MRLAFFCMGDRPHAKYAVDSFRKFFPDSEIFQITDMDSPVVDGVIDYYRMDYKGGMMGAMLWGYSKLPKDDTLLTFADDCILDRQIDIKEDFDVALVKRENFMFVKDGNLKQFIHTFPYSNGITIIKNHEFYKDCYKRFQEIKDKETNGRKYDDWWGDMAAISDVAATGKYKVKDLHESMYSRKPSVCGDGNNGSTVVWHYAGDRKEWMKHHGKGELACV